MSNEFKTPETPGVKDDKVIGKVEVKSSEEGRQQQADLNALQDKELKNAKRHQGLEDAIKEKRKGLEEKQGMSWEEKAGGTK